MSDFTATQELLDSLIKGFPGDVMPDSVFLHGSFFTRMRHLKEVHRRRFKRRAKRNSILKRK